MKLFLTRNKFKLGFVYIWIAPKMESMYLDPDGVWESDNTVVNRAVVIQPEAFKTVTRMELPKPGSIQELSRVDFVLKV